MIRILAALVLLAAVTQGCSGPEGSVEATHPPDRRSNSLVKSSFPEVTEKTRLRVGNLPLCSQTILSAAISHNDVSRFDGPDYFLDVKLSREAGGKFAEITREMVGKELPVLLDGKVLLSPMIQEQILGGMLQLSAGKGELERALQVMNEPCR